VQLVVRFASLEVFLFNYKHKKIIDKVIELGGVVYGGYIRDSFAKREPRDIDICFFDYNKYYKFKDSLEKIKFRCEITSSFSKDIDETKDIETKNTSYFYGNCKEHNKYENNFTKIDLFLVEKSIFMYGHSPDVNINRLMYSSKGIETYNTEQSSLEILSDIKNNTFFPEERCPQERIDKLLNKGWELHPYFIIKDIIE